MSRKHHSYRIAATLAFLASAVGAAASSQPQPPANVLLILLDDVGLGDLSPYDAGTQARVERVPTPHIQKLAEEGVTFDEAYAGSPVCAPSRGVLYTGRSAANATVRAYVKELLPPDELLISHVAKASETGHRTYMWASVTHCL